MLAYDLSVAWTLSRSITGSGGLMQLGTGTLVLTGTNDAYNGITTIGSSATLQLGSGAATGSLSGRQPSPTMERWRSTSPVRRPFRIPSAAAAA